MNRTFPTLFLILALAFACQSYKMSLFSLKPSKPLENIVTESAVNSLQQPSPNQAYNMTSFQFLGLSYLNSPRQLNNTVSSFQSQPRINATWRVNKTVQYSVTNIKMSYKYNSQGQQTKISPSNKEIMVSNGSVSVEMEFVWRKNVNQSQTYGWATAKTTSYDLSYIYQIVDDPTKQAGHPMANLTEFYPFKLRSFVITDYGNMTDEDKPYIMSLLNNVDATDTVKELLQAYNGKSYSVVLGSRVYRTTIGAETYYGVSIDAPDGPYTHKITIYFDVMTCGYNVTKDGISYAYRLVNTSVPTFEDALIEPQRLDTAIYGEQQEFISFSQYRNFIVLAIQTNATKTLLQQETSSTFQFHFTVGELFDVFTNLDKKFNSHLTLKSYFCNGTDDFSKIKVSQASNFSFYVDMGWKCDMYVFVSWSQIQQFANINLTGRLEITAFPEIDSTEFWLKNFTLTSLQVDDSFGYKLINKSKAERIVSSVASKLLGFSKLIGSGWQHTVEFDNPSFVVTKTGTFVTNLSLKPTLTVQ